MRNLSSREDTSSFRRQQEGGLKSDVSDRRSRCTILGSCLIGLLLWIFSCAANPVTGKQELMLLSETDEIKLGQETDLQVVSEYGLYEDPKLTADLNGICQRLGKLSHRPNLTYHFKVLDASVVNAFAAPGGYVYFTRGILATLNNEAELAGVMGHEIGHITARHSAHQYSQCPTCPNRFGSGIARHRFQCAVRVGSIRSGDVIYAFQQG